MSRRDAAAIPPFHASDLEDRHSTQQTLDRIGRSLSIVANYVVHVVRSTSASMTVGDETMILATTGGGGITITLPPAIECEGHELNIKKVDAGVGNLTVDAHGAETIDGALTQVSAVQWTNFRLICNGVAWYLA